MKQKTKILLIGIDPFLLDFSRPEFAAMPGLTADVIENGTKAALDELNGLGYEATKCWVDLGDTAADTIQKCLREATYDGIIIGAGIRVPEAQLMLFEQIVNVVHAHAPGAKIVFNTSPKDNVAAVKRWL